MAVQPFSPANFKITPMHANGLPIGLPFIAMFNPDSFSISEKVEWDNNVPAGGTGADQTYKKSEPRKFSVEFYIDATGAAGPKIPINAQVMLFREATTVFRGLYHKPPYLMVQYGLFIMHCVLDETRITYTMFDKLGVPLRAKIYASFIERKESKLNQMFTMLSSPDLTHKVPVKAGDTLPLLTKEIYNDQTYYLQIARVNKIKNFRKLQPGSELIFPPLSN